jgi:hypothetical protein
MNPEETFDFVTLIFSPTISPDAPDRVNWLSDLRQFRSRREAILDAELNLRQPEIAESIDAGLANLHSLELNCRLEGRMVSTNGVVLRGCTKGDIQKLADNADLLSEFSIANPPNEPHALNGGQLRSILGMQTRIAVNLDEVAQFSGEGPTAASSDNVVVALIDEEGFFGAERHPAYYDVPNPGMTCGAISAGFSSRVVGFGCNTSTCTPGSHWGTFPGNHGIITMAPFSSIMEGQDPCFTSSASREARSHGAFEATLRVHRNDAGAAQERVAMEFAALGGAHIISLSQGNGYTSCNNPRGFNANITAAADFVNSLDVVLVRSAGNNVAACNDNCYITANSSVRPEIITVGAMFDSIGAGNYIGWPLMDERFTNMNLTPNCSTPCPASTACWSSSIGGANLRIGGATVPNARGIVDVVGPADHALAASYTSDAAYSYVTSGAGTSQAAPAVASAVVSLVDWALVNGFPSIINGGSANVSLIAMGDGQVGTATSSHLPGAIPDSYSGLDRLWGAGRLRFRLPTDRGMDGPWGWGWGSVVMNPATTHYVRAGGGPFNADVDSYRVVASWNEVNLNGGAGTSAADFVLSVISTAPSSGSCPSAPQGTATTHRSDLSFDVQKQVRIRRADIVPMHNRCVYARIDYLSGPSSRTVFYTDVWEDLDRECAENLGQCGDSSCTSYAGCVD